MSALYNPTGLLGRIVDGMTLYITGDVFLTYFILLIILAVVMLALWKIDVQWVAISLIGIILTLLAYSSEWLVFAGVLFIMFAIFFARYFTGDN